VRDLGRVAVTNSLKLKAFLQLYFFCLLYLLILAVDVDYSLLTHAR